MIQLRPGSPAGPRPGPFGLAVILLVMASPQSAQARAEVDLPAPGTAVALSLAATPTAAPLTLDDVSVNIRANLEARDGALMVLLLYTFRARRAGHIRWTAAAPLQLPVLVPVVRDAVLDRGAFPAAAQHVRFQTTSNAKLLRTGDNLLLTGELARGRPLDMRISYPLAAPRQRIVLGLRGVVGESALAVAAYGVKPVRLRVHADRAAREANYDEGDARYAALSLTRPLRRGEIARVEVSDLAAVATWPGRVLAGLFALTVLLCGAALLRRRDADTSEAS